MPTLLFAVPRKTPLNETERAICDRLLAFRKSTRLTRIAFGEKVGADSSTLSNIEYRRAPLRYSLGKRICDAFGLNPFWLAGNDGAPPFHLGRLDDSAANPNGQLLFSEGVNIYLAPLRSPDAFLERWAAVHPAHVSKPPATGGDWKFAQAAVDARVQIMREMEADLEKFLPPETLVLPKHSGPLPSAPVTETDLLPQLRRRLVQATTARGAKTALAEKLGVSQATVTEWLNGAIAPSAENTLRLLQWVSEAEAQPNKKAPAVFRARPERRPKRKPRK